MFSLYTTLVFALAISTAFSAPVDDHPSSPKKSSSLDALLVLGQSDSAGKLAQTNKNAESAARQQAGDTDDGFAYVYFDNGNDGNFTTAPGGVFNVDWKGKELLLAGMGYDNGTNNRVFKYTGSLQMKKRGHFGLLGMGVVNDTAEVYYYVTDFTKEHDRTVGSFGDKIGTVDCDGSSYDISQFSSLESDGTTTLMKYFSTRTKSIHSGQVQGTISLDCHWKAWVSLGMPSDQDLGQQMMVVVVAPTSSRHAKDDSGNVSVTVSSS